MCGSANVTILLATVDLVRGLSLVHAWQEQPNKLDEDWELVDWLDDSHQRHEQYRLEGFTDEQARQMQFLSQIECMVKTTARAHECRPWLLQLTGLSLSPFGIGFHRVYIEGFSLETWITLEPKTRMHWYLIAFLTLR